MAGQAITVETMVQAPPDRVWQRFTDPAHVTSWNFASDDWHCPAAEADLREGGRFRHRMEARDGSAGFDFEGTYTAVVPGERLDHDLGGRAVTVRFAPVAAGTQVRVTFAPEDSVSYDHQRAGWAAILRNFARYAEAEA